MIRQAVSELPGFLFTLRLIMFSKEQGPKSGTPDRSIAVIGYPLNTQSHNDSGRHLIGRNHTASDRSRMSIGCTRFRPSLIYFSQNVRTTTTTTTIFITYAVLYDTFCNVVTYDTCIPVSFSCITYTWHSRMTGGRLLFAGGRRLVGWRESVNEQHSMEN